MNKYTLYRLTHPIETYFKSRYYLDLADRFEEIYIHRSYKLLYSAITPETTVLDIGASFGDTAIFFALNPNVKQIFSYEPMPKVFGYLKKNTSNYENIRCINKAIGKSQVKHLDKDSFLGSFGKDYDKIDEVDGGEEVASITLNEALKGLKKVAIKCDCEGSEGYIFNDADLSEVYAIQLEYHNNRENVVSALKENGFRIAHEDKQMPDLLGARREGFGTIFAEKK